VFFLLMTEFAYINKKYVTISQILFKTLMSYYLRITQHVKNNVCKEKMLVVKDWAQ